MAAFSLVREALAYRQFALSWAGPVVSQFGDSVMSVALPLLVLTVTRSASDLGLVVAARLVPTVLFLLLGGALSDRISRRLAMLVADASRALISAALGVLALTGTLNLTGMVVGAVISGLFDALFFLSRVFRPVARRGGGGAPDRQRLAEGFSRTLARGLLGPLVGAVISSTIGVSWSLIIYPGTFVVSVG